ncbi:MAG: MBL fold metallo-hydrolase [Anaerolineales bacterium]|nr:MBL fold metallo-hydrolase [Anaerolineales bacterium]
MARLVLLGTASAVPDPVHENTHLAVVGDQGTVLVDCVGTPAVRLPQAGIAIESVTDLVATHFHPDHVAGIPLLLMNMWLSGRREGLRIYGLHHCLKRVEDMMASYNWENWPDFFPVAFHRLPERERMPLLETDEVRILASPVRHLIPTIGLRFEGKVSGRSIAYSCDTEPCQMVVELARGADLLIHEASGASAGHSTAAQAGSIAREAGVRSLLLIHYSPGEGDALRREASAEFAGEVALAQDLASFEL